MGYKDNDDTVFAPATVPGTGAISIIRVSGPKAIEIADKVVVCHSGTGTFSPGPESAACEKTASIAAAKGYTIRFGSVYMSDGQLLDEVLVSVFRAPRSYTGEDSVEIGCHASSYIVSELSGLLAKAGARPAEAGEFTRRAFLNGKMDLAQAEAVADLIASQSAAAHRIAVSQMRGGFSDELRGMRTELLEIVSLMELELDFSEEDVEFADRGHLDELLGRVIAHVDRLAESFRLGNAIKNGVPTAIVGAVNVGKSTLLNALLGEERAIVSEVSGTTRDTIEETLNIDGILFRLIDTAGLRDTEEIVERIGIERTRRKIAEAQIILGMVDGSLPPEEIAARITDVASLADCTHQTVCVLINKTDLIGDRERLKSVETQVLHLAGKSENPSEMENPSHEDRGKRGQAPVRKNDNAEFTKLAGKDQCNKKVNDVNFNVSLFDNKVINLYFISAKTGYGLDVLKHDLATSQKDKIDNAGSVTVTNLRHFEALRSAAEALRRAQSGLRSGIPTDLLSQDIRDAISDVGAIVGDITNSDILTYVFQNFCVGK